MYFYLTWAVKHALISPYELYAILAIVSEGSEWMWKLAIWESSDGKQSMIIVQDEWAKQMRCGVGGGAYFNLAREHKRGEKGNRISRI